MSKKDKGKNTDSMKETVSSGHKKNEKNLEEKENIFQEVTLNLESIENNANKNKKKKKKKKKHKILRAFLTLILIGFIILFCFFVKRMNENGWTMGGLVATILGHDSNTVSKLSRINILVIGQSQNLTDTLLVCTYDPKTQDFGMLSIPRDTFVGRNKNNATASDKINAIYQISPRKLLEKVNEITGLDIQYYVKVDTKGFRDLVDSVGGIYFDVPIDMNYDDPSQDLHIHLKAGYQLLDGDKAEQVVRFRHNSDGSSYSMEYGDQDIGRMKTQRAFLKEVIRQLAKAENIAKIDDFIKIANENVETNFSLWSLRDYAPYVLDLNLEEIKAEYLPGTTEKINGLWFYAYNKKQTQEVVNKLFKTELTAEQEQNAEIKVNILNGTNDESNLNNVENLLKESGYNVVSTGITTSMKTTTIINRTNQDASVAKELQELIGIGVVSSTSSEGSDSTEVNSGSASGSNANQNSSSSNSEVDFTIIIGSDY